jgi:putative spermidine/putrescine transport system permease protein
MSMRPFQLVLLLPLVIFTGAFLIVPLAILFPVAGQGPSGMAGYWLVLSETRYRDTMVMTVLVASITTVLSLLIATVCAQFLAGRTFPGRDLLVAMLTFPLAFPGVVVGFMIILLGGRLGVAGIASEVLMGEKLVFAYSAVGLLVGYLYFSIPRVILTLIAAVETLDRVQIEAARSLGANAFALQKDIVLPALRPALLASGALCFATAMGAFGTAFTLATRIDVMPMLIYTEFTLQANFAAAASLSIALGCVTWLILAVARMISVQQTVAAA